ncbi:lysosomal alpha-glucosidase [Polyodon spathula]|uniref:lysosomal alpha-glucosidase n=1 Tax=Polyodon spathula TaxID=7913 RepID=UPI001B7E7DDD|nr:lysosomal alpha-glucosidase [Polyodon spathula]
MVSYKLLTPEDVYFTAPVPVADEEMDEQKHLSSRLCCKNKTCSTSTAFIALATFLFVVCCVWLIGTIFWLKNPGSQLLHRPPSPSLASENREGGRGQSSEKCNAIPETHRFDCYPERQPVVTRELCEVRGCCFIQASAVPSPAKDGVPWCFYPPDFPSYTLDSLNDTELGYVGKLTRKQKTYYPRDIWSLQLSVMYETDSRLHIKMTDATSTRFEVPISVPNATKKAASPGYSVEFSKEPFGLIVKRTSTGNVLINTTVAPLFFTDQFLQMSTTLPSQYIYGLGEHRAGFLHSVQWNTLTFWARDVPPTELTNLYGVHPFYLDMEPGGLAHGVFLLNSNAMDVALQPAPALTWRTIGGVLDIYIFIGPDPSSVIQQYMEVVGFPSMPPFWALGFHLCRWGYQTSNATWKVVKGMRNYGIPQDAQWNDIDYMDGFRDFTTEPENFATLPEMVKDLHDHGQRYVMILDPGISSTQPSGSYWPFDEGLKRGIFINDSDGNTLIGKVWPGLTAFPDFSNPETHQWWYENLQKFYDKIPFDGLWIDMNEPSNFEDGSLKGCPSNELENPPYTPGILGGSLRAKTVCASAVQKTSVHYNMHSLYGLMEAMASASALRRMGKRPFIISRSTFPSQGRYSGHWLGDNRSQWKDLYVSIPGMLNFNLLGIPLVGADICGFGGSTTEELCVRWMQLGAFYPFSRNHNTNNEQPQDPTDPMFSPLARTAMKEVLLLRYSLFPFLYTLFHHAHLQGHTVARPLLFEFPEDVTTYSIDRQFLWGRSLLVTPVLDPGVNSVIGYFPKGVWYDYYTGTSLKSSGEKVKLEAPLGKINLYLREGAVIPTQTPNTTLWSSSGNPLHLTATLSEKGLAEGDLFWDDGESLDTYETDSYAYIVFNVSENTFTSTVLHENVQATYIMVETVSFFGVKDQPTNVTVDSKETPFTYLKNKVLTVSNLSLNLNKGFTIHWS